ncbi:uncharacterized protein LOC143365330 [Halictus rubicundus]|uniref:uncharacterized protein LOC143365330 n=1 Tax=Halictus rubicundus TaxID=77578 RepID=UPI0040367E60
METDEVIVEKVIESVSDAKPNEQVSSSKENNGKSTIIEDTSMAQNENEKKIDFEVNQIGINCDKSLIENNTLNRQSCNTTNGVNSQQKSFTNTSINHNEKFINDDNNKKVTNDLVVGDSQQTDDICIIHGNSNGNKLSSLTAIALEYGNSDSETESSSNLNIQNNDQPIVLKEVQMQSYRINNKSSSEESDSEDDSSSISDSSVLIESDDSDGDNTNKPKGKKKTNKQRNDELKSELDDLPPIEDLKISVPEVLCDPLGQVAWMVEQLVVVQPKPDKPTLNLDTILFVDKGKRALGKIFDVFGQVKEPHYCVRFNSSEHIQECDIKVGMTVYYCPNTEYTSLVFLHELMKIRGIDASADEPPEFSDDEEERAYYEKLKQAKQTSKTNEGDVPFKRKRASSPNAGWQSSHPWNRNKQKNRKGYQGQFPSTQAGSQLQNPWVHPYQNNWSSIPGGFHSDGAELYGYGIYPPALQSMQYVNPNVNTMNQNLYNSHNYYNEDGTTAPLNPRIPYNMGPRVNSEHLLYQNRPNSPSSLRFRNANVTWEPQMMTRMNTPWISLPPPPPPPPPPSSSPSSPGTS